MLHGSSGWTLPDFVTLLGCRACVALRRQMYHSRHPWREARVPHGSPRSCPRAHYRPIIPAAASILLDRLWTGRSHRLRRLCGPSFAVLFLIVALQGCHLQCMRSLVVGFCDCFNVWPAKCRQPASLLCCKVAARFRFQILRGFLAFFLLTGACSPDSIRSNALPLACHSRICLALLRRVTRPPCDSCGPPTSDPPHAGPCGTPCTEPAGLPFFPGTAWHTSCDAHADC